ncbi:MAG: hypothetical protein HQK75_07490 [Candidatus Magnetomorum sp.]|nr:hypothetical protein [Candidatus Magnetomorum sp.]
MKKKRSPKPNLSKIKRIARKKAIRKHKNDKLRLVRYQITYDPMEDEYKDRVPEDIQEEVGVNLYSLSLDDPANAMKRLLELKKIYPDYPRIYNYLARAYSGLNRQKDVIEIVCETYEKFPEYLFAKVNYANICLSKGELDKIPVILEGKFELQALYPDRDVFHVTEANAFWGLVGRYFVSIGDIQHAKNVLKLMEDIDSESEIFQVLKRELKQKFAESQLMKKVDMLPKANR